MAPLLTMILVATASGGTLYNQKQNVAFAVREGARYGASHDLSDPTWASTVASVVSQRSGGNLTSSDICVSLVSGTGTFQGVYNTSSTYSTAGGGNSCIPNDGSADDGMRVQVKVTKAGIWQAVFFTMPVTLSSEAIGKFEQ